MNNSAQSVKDKLKNISKIKNVEFNSVMKLYMYERFIERLSKSNYKDNFILKGGFYLSKLFGLDNRSTMDIDAAIMKAEFTEENIVKMVTEIISINVEDNVKFIIKSITPIRDEDEYGGLRVVLEFCLENIRDNFHIDIVTGDPIFPGPCSYRYESLISKDVYKIWAYNLETILAEKIETILSKLEMTSRMKDYYDIYLVHKLAFDRIDRNKFKGAAQTTFKKREFNADLIESLNIVKDSDVLRDKWGEYSRNNNYAKTVEFDEAVNSLESFIDILVLVEV